MRIVQSFKSFTTEAVVRSCSVEKVFLEIFANSQENTCARVSFLIKLQNFYNNKVFREEALVQVFSGEFCGIFKKPLVAATNSTPFSTISLINISKIKIIFNCNLLLNLKDTRVLFIFLNTSYNRVFYRRNILESFTINKNV